MNLHQDAVSLRGRFNNAKHYNENARLKEIYSLYSTLQERPVGEEFQNNNLDEDRDINIQFLRNHKVNLRITMG